MNIHANVLISGFQESINKNKLHICQNKLHICQNVASYDGQHAIHRLVLNQIKEKLWPIF